MIRMASTINLEWIQDKLPLLKETNVNELCGLKPAEESKNSTTKATIPSVGSKRPPQEDIHTTHGGTLSSSVQSGTDKHSKEAKLLELKARFAKRQKR